MYFEVDCRNGEDGWRLLAKISAMLNEMGHKLINNSLIGDNLTRSAEAGGDRWFDGLKHILAEIRKADVCVFEVSIGDLSIGFWVWSALSMGKAVILLGKSEKVLALFEGIGPNSMITVVYKDGDLKEKLDLALKQAGTLVNTRFNLFIPRELMAYLDWVAKNLGVNRSEYIRKLIEKEVRRRK